ncbi:MAG: hypothetical protein M1816_008164 [Peltula sp. TS41687]|nr:MAG: hypothetical protein M1816_008164 [Peltula sp. TS41687]
MNRVTDFLGRWGEGQATWSGFVQCLLLCGLLPCVFFLTRQLRSDESHIRDVQGSSTSQVGLRKRYLPAFVKSILGGHPQQDAAHTDPGLLKKHSSFRSYTTQVHGFTYSKVRVFYRSHPHADQLPQSPQPLPLFVFIHGLGGSLAQFQPLLKSLVNLSPCLGIDLPGCGVSSFSPRSWEAYTPEALVELISTVIEDFRDKEASQDIIFIGHSMGCSLSALLASPSSPYPYQLAECTQGLVAICPRITNFSPEQVRTARTLLRVPNPLFDLWRKWDRRGGIDSASVSRFVGKKADRETRELQLRFNTQSRSAVWRRMVFGLLRLYDRDGRQVDGVSGPEVWAGLDIPVLLVAGEDDLVTKPEEVEKISNILRNEGDLMTRNIESESRAVGNTDLPPNRDDMSSGDPSSVSRAFRKAGKVVKAVILPSPASHSLLYAPATSRTLAGLISDFLAAHVCSRLSLGWQLQYLSTEGKWDVKNLAKWKAVAPVSEPIGGVFRAMKTLREVDEEHCPEEFVRHWRGRIRDVIDISHESPVYDPRGLERGGIAYHKFPTVSKIPPTMEEVEDFIKLVDRLTMTDRSTNDETGVQHDDQQRLIVVHCHYGFNRTGFFIVSYLVERRGYELQLAIDEFAKSRPPGIRHEHFIDTLYLRYLLALRRGPMS